MHPLRRNRTKNRKGSYIDYKNGFGMIKLTQGKYAIVDIEDFERLNKLKWSAIKEGRTFYAINRKTKMPYSIISCPTGKMIDHINGNGIDNRKLNLRVCTRQQNVMNRRSYKNKSGFKGVTWIPKRGYYQVKGGGGNNRYYLGSYKNPIEAARAFDKDAIKRYGEFAQTNFPKEDYA